MVELAIDTTYESAKELAHKILVYKGTTNINHNTTDNYIEGILPTHIGMSMYYSNNKNLSYKVRGMYLSKIHVSRGAIINMSSEEMDMLQSVVHHTSLIQQ